ncbi:MAG: Translation elongation factor EFTs/EF1B dimerization [Dehalococcoidia bacterium]|nr:Translation elongation factor EFTs/EF1B dimerization [Dehalococcoidia bacterium]
MEISASTVRELRERTGAGVMDCRRALEDAAGDIDKATDVLRQNGLARAEKRASRVASQGLVDTYLHAGGRIGAMVELNCETDFVARSDYFHQLAHDIAMQVAAANPTYIGDDDIPPASDVNPEDCLLLQPFIKDPGKQVKDIITDVIAKTGENIKVRRFSRFELGN